MNSRINKYMNHFLNIIIYLCGSLDNILKNRRFIFEINSFANDMNYIYNRLPRIKNIFSKFFIEYWDIYEVMIHHKTIIRIFRGDNQFMRNITRIAFLYDDLNLFKLINNPEHLNNDMSKLINKYESNIKRYTAYNIATYIYKSYPILDRITYRGRVYEDIDKHIEYIANKVYFFINANTCSYAKFNSTIRNLIKYYLFEKKLFFDTSIHDFLMKHNSFIFIHEYFTYDEFKEYRPWVLRTIKNKMYNNKALFDMFSLNKHIAYLMNEKYPSDFLSYHIFLYDMINTRYFKFITSDILSGVNLVRFYHCVSAKNIGGIDMEERQLLCKRLKSGKTILNPNMPIEPRSTRGISRKK